MDRQHLETDRTPSSRHADRRLRVGRASGFIYIRKEYPLALERLQKAARPGRAYACSADKVLGHDFSFDIQGIAAPAPRCGESSALMAIVVKGADSSRSGGGAEIRSYRSPEPYKGRAFVIPVSVSSSRKRRRSNGCRDGKESQFV